MCSYHLFLWVNVFCFQKSICRREKNKRGEEVAAPSHTPDVHFEALSSLVDITSSLSFFLNANDARSAFGGERLSDSFVTDGLVAGFLH